MIINDDILLGSDPNGLAGAFAGDAARNGHSVAYLAEPDGNTRSKLKFDAFRLSPRRMIESNNYLLRANKSIHRSWPTGDTATNDQLRRDAYLVRWCHRVYSVGLFTDDASLLKISGDMAWPAQIYVDRFLYDREPMRDCELYMFDMKSESWFHWNTCWTRINDIPKPSGVYAVLGSDRISRAAKAAIDQLWY